MQLAPFAHAQIAKEIGVTFLYQQLVRLLVFQRLVEEMPEIEQADEIRFVIGKLGLGSVSGITGLERPLARVLNAERRRDDEFNAVGPMDKRELRERLDSTLAYAYDVLAGLGTADLERTWNVQGYSETGLAIVLHVVEHFSYHTGQITLHTKLLLDIDTGYYAGQDLNRTGE